MPPARLYVGASCPYGGAWSWSPWQPSSSSISTSTPGISLLDGALKIKDLVTKTKALGMGAVALTDHGNMFGAIQLYKASKEQGVQAILGCEVNVARRRDGDGEGSGRAGHDEAVDHLVLLAADEPGYRNLVRVVSAGHVDPASQLAPSVTLDTIAQHRAGLIGLTGCMGGVLAQRILEQGEAAGRAELDRLRNVFEPGSLYVELQDHNLQEQGVLNGITSPPPRADMEPAPGGPPTTPTSPPARTARASSTSPASPRTAPTPRPRPPTTAASEDAPSRVARGDDPPVPATAPEAVKNTLAIAERCRGLKLKLDKPMLPSFPLPEGMSASDYFRKVARDGLERRFSEMGPKRAKIDEGAYRKRLGAELDVIVGMDFPGYFLIVWDFIRFAKENDIPVGPGRGSGAGSLVAYSMRITDIDPLPYNLLFERFLNPERVSMPDFDVDFCMDRRDKVIAYVADKYGKDSVGQIATFHELKAKSVIKDVARAMGFPAMEAQKIANLIPNKGQGQTYTIPEALEVEPKLKALRDSGSHHRRAPQAGDEARGAHSATPACTPPASSSARGPLWDHVPCFKNGDLIVTQYDKDDVEKAGLVKFDFLGLKTLTVIDVAVRLINQRTGPSRRRSRSSEARKRSTWRIRAPSRSSSPARPPACSSSRGAACRSSSRTSSPTPSKTSSPPWPCIGRGRWAAAW